nr:tetracyclin repressor, C-terminal all-alpha domain protein [uncultured bacterium]
MLAERHTRSLPEENEDWRVFLKENALSFRTALLSYRDGARIHAGTRPQSLIVSIVGTLAVTLINGDTAWPVICYATTMAVLVLAGLALLRSRNVPAERSPVA